MLQRLARFTVRRRRWVLAGSALFAVLAVVLGGSVVSALKSGGFSDPGSESIRAAQLQERIFHTSDPNIVLLVTARQGTVDDPTVKAQGVALTRQLTGEPGVSKAYSYWTLGSPQPLRSEDSRQALILAIIRGTDDQVHDRAAAIVDRMAGTRGPVTVAVGGQGEVFREVGTQVEKDLRKAEAITFPVVLLLLVLVFGSVVAAGLPLGIGALSVVGTLLVLKMVSSLTDVSIYSLNLTTAMGIGLGIDYALFIVSRFREEMRGGLSTEDAVVRSVETAGRTVLFSALTVAVSLAALLVFPLYFLRSFAYAGIAVVALSAIAAVVFLPSVLATLGPRVDKLVLWRHKQKEVGEGFWHRLATFVMKRPIPVAVSVVAVLLVLGAPFLGVKFGQPDDRVLPTTAPARQVQDDIRAKFEDRESTPLEVVAPDTGRAQSSDEARYAMALSQVPGVSRVDAATGSYIHGKLVLLADPATSVRFSAPRATWYSVVPGVEPVSPAGEGLVKNIRAAPAPFPVLVGGLSAELVDSKQAIFSRVPLAAGIIAVVTFIVLFLMTGSVVLPLKALALNVLSLSATFGAMVFIFQEGHFSHLLNFTPTGTLDTSNPILMFCIAFGLSMDYEVFLLSRIKEEHDRTGDNVTSVAVGLERTGRIVTAAAALLAMVFIAFSTSQISFIKMFGIGLALAVVMDATLIRGLLVPAFMRLMGGANWWAPRPLRWLHERLGFRESDSLPAPASIATERRVVTGDVA
jgi:putative drug exporter of the RND superfamily